MSSRSSLPFSIPYLFRECFCFPRTKRFIFLEVRQACIVHCEDSLLLYTSKLIFTRRPTTQQHDLYCYSKQNPMFFFVHHASIISNAADSGVRLCIVSTHFPSNLHVLVQNPTTSYPKQMCSLRMV